ncbi:MAG: homoserine kinase [Anaeroplasmataceae bacterium]|nr:homoserine kinase [Anaeroplasmataceae bacterium]
MFYVKVCATSANVCVGFDVLGLALNLENTFSFEKADDFCFVGFEKPFDQKENNLVYHAYEAVFRKVNKNLIPVKIGFQGQIPIARGLGSSSSLIVAGMLAANHILKNPLGKNELLQIGAKLEGHPDNIAPALFGGLVASYYHEGYHSINYPVSQDLKFITISPNYEVSTAKARAILPKMVSYADATANLSYIIHIPKAFESGDLKLMNDLFCDKLHEPYRKKLIKEYDMVYQICRSLGAVLAISGSGSTMLVITKNANDIEKFKIKDCQVRLLEIGKEARIEEV